MSSFGQEVDTDGVKSEEAIYQRLKVWSSSNMTSEGSNGQSDVSEQYCDHRSIQGENGIGHHGPISGRTVLDIRRGQACRENVRIGTKVAVRCTHHMFVSPIWRAGKRVKCVYSRTETRIG
jgi:hypothetical protein